MASTFSCTIGIELESKYHKTTYSQVTGLINFHVFSEREKLLLKLTQIEEMSNICYHHKKKFISSDMQCHKKNVQIHSNYTRNHTKV